MSEWQPIETAPKGVKVLVCGNAPGYGHIHTMLARYWKKHTLEVAEEYEAEDWVDEAPDGTPYMPEGWYEESHGGDAVNLEPTHWMPLPPPPVTP